MLFQIKRYHLDKTNKQNRNRLIDTENRLTAVRGRGWGLCEKGKGIKKKKNPHRHRQQYGDYQRESGEREERVKVG